VGRQEPISRGLVKSKEIYQPMSSALKATGRLFVHNNLLASTFMSIAFVSSAISGASGNAAANSCKKKASAISQHITQVLDTIVTTLLVLKM